MDEIVFCCSKCGTELVAAVSEAGEEFDCPKCGASQRVPVLEAVKDGPKRVTTRMSAVSAPAAPPPATKTAKAVPPPAQKKTIIVPRKEEDAYDAEEAGDPIGGQGLKMFAVAVGTVGGLLCLISVFWALVSLWRDNGDWWMSFLMFTSAFLCGLMGLALAQLSRFMVRVGERIDELDVE